MSAERRALHDLVAHLDFVCVLLVPEETPQAVFDEVLTARDALVRAGRAVRLRDEAADASTPD